MRRRRLWPTGTYTEWRYPTRPGGFGRLEWAVTPMTDPSPDGYFWSHQFWLVGGEAGYVGLQTAGSEPTGRIAIFSVWNAVAAEGPAYAAPFGGEGEGFTARIPYHWRVGTSYRFSVASGAEGRWSAWVATGAGDPQPIGQITVPGHWGGVRDQSVMWTERYAGPLASCADLRCATAMFSVPSADSAPPVAHRNYLYQPVGCPGSSVTDVPGGVVQRMGCP